MAARERASHYIGKAILLPFDPSAALIKLAVFCAWLKDKIKLNTHPVHLETSLKVLHKTTKVTNAHFLHSDFRLSCIHEILNNTP